MTIEVGDIYKGIGNNSHVLYVIVLSRTSCKWFGRSTGWRDWPWHSAATLASELTDKERYEKLN